jgi:hypothetical protein
MTQAKPRKPPTDRQAQAASARSGGRIVEPPCCAASADAPPKHPTDSPPHRQTVAQLKILKKPTATQALGPPALHR